MKRKSKKGLKYRGNRTQGYGIHKKHRGGGSRGGRGYAGSKKHKRIGYLKFEPEHYDRRGFTPMSKKQGRKIRAINVSILSTIIGKDSKEIDLTKMKIHKLLGSGSAEGLKGINVIVDKASNRAVEKITEVGGTVTIRAKKNKKAPKKELPKAKE
ncbi:50S ribosomal protein L15 [archaeon]|nr:50S ribosomal protein L15 [archaeon]|tara:strand:+ start:3630 stop:4094 length:465 start_codon:yes stop_codon:yes gene_type:complete